MKLENTILKEAKRIMSEFDFAIENKIKNPNDNLDPINIWNGFYILYLISEIKDSGLSDKGALTLQNLQNEFVEKANKYYNKKRNNKGEKNDISCD